MTEASPEAEDAGHLRPIERTVLRLENAGQSDAEIAWRLRRSPGYVRRTLALAKLPRPAAPVQQRAPWDLRPIERRVLRGRDNGVDDVEMAARLKRSPAHVQRVEALADYKLAQAAGGATR
ncbi:MAG: hypothetical protein ACR2QE_05605 [Acidimicrobiales bacterium]